MNDEKSQLELVEVLPARLAITAMKDSGYKNTAYALAELVDNAVQAQAELVEVFCSEKWQLVNDRERRRISELAVLDNGCGMTSRVLHQALQFGNGTRLQDRSGIGRFGMGLPNSSVSQAGRVEVWTWQNGITNALYSYLDVEEIEQGRQREVPGPVLKSVPARYADRSGGINHSGTLVVWSKIEQQRLSWKTGRATLENVERLAGRIYRKFIADGRLHLRLCAFDDRDTVTFDTYSRSNDPLYLISPSTTPDPFSNQPMFQRWGESDEVFEVPLDGETHQVTVRISWAKKETVPEDRSDRGAKEYGKHAARNVGVSIVRADREIDLDSSWARSYEPTERWWGVEVDFPPALDEVFGLTNNKQAATIFSQMSQFDWEQEAEEGETFLAFKERLREEEDPRVHLMDVVDYVRLQLSEVRKRLADQTKGLRPHRRRPDDPSVDDLASEKFKERAKAGHTTPSDREEWTPETEKGLVEDLTKNKRYPENAAREIAAAVSARGRKTIFLDAYADSLAFFNVETRPGGLTEIVFNNSHPAYEKLVKVLDDDVRGATDKELVERINNASDTMRMLLAAWARYEIEDAPNRERLQTSRHEWGKMARVFLSDGE